jgi:hypothetical protein
MLTSKKQSLQPILKSSAGVHLTSYILNNGALEDLKTQIQETIQQSEAWLCEVMTKNEINHFLKPLYTLLFDARIFDQIKGNIGIFRNKDTFSVLNITHEVERSCHMGTSFHVKPLLKWLQIDYAFLILVVKENQAQLYLGGQDSFKLFDTLEIPLKYSEQNAQSNLLYLSQSKDQVELEKYSFINDWIRELTKKSKPKLFVVTQKEKVEMIKRSVKYKNYIITTSADVFGQHKLGDVCSLVREILNLESQRVIDKTLNEFRFAYNENLVSKNVFEIARLVAQNKVKKLIVTDDINIFGKVNKKSGDLKIHPFDMGHDDDDILDDLAQMVLLQGGEVVVTSRTKIPQGLPIMAIIDGKGKELQKMKSIRKYELLNERPA